MLGIGPIKSITNKTVKVAIGGRTCPAKGMKTIAVPIPSGPSGTNGTLLITDSLAVFKGTGHEDVAMELARALSSGDAQYDLDSSWGLTPIMKYEGMVANPYYVNSSYWSVFVEPIGSGGPEPLFVEYKSLYLICPFLSFSRIN